MIYFKFSLLLLPLAFVLGCSTSSIPENSNIQRLSDLQVVDCLLPGQVRGLGQNLRYLTARRPIKTTAGDCRIRGGEYVEFDQADYTTALAVWREAAEAGDAEAQVNVGEIYERGLGTSPDYQIAAVWYQRAADQGNARAQFNLGTLYEKGLGVDRDSVRALNLYRKAWGLPEDDLLFQSAVYREQEALRELLNQQLEEKNLQIENLGRQIAQLQSSLVQQQDNTQAQAEIQELRNSLAALERERESTLTRHTALPIFREPPQADGTTQPTVALSTLPYDAEFGRYYALIIGNQDYLRLPDLQSPHNDALKIAELLETKYGFIVETLLDADNVQIRQAINDLNDVLTEADNLLIFYAGHGNRVQTGNVERGYWLPVNADAAPNNTFWVENEFITSHLQLLDAKRILVVADSCYAGLLSDAREFRAFGGEIPTYNEAQFRFKLQRKSRLLISSGGDQPVLDNGGQGNSVFAKAFLDVLESNTKILASPELFVRVRDLVRTGARAVDFEQEPEFKTIDFTGNEFGDFFFVPRELSTISDQSLSRR